MKLPRLLRLAGLGLGLGLQVVRAQVPSVPADPYAGETPAQRDVRMAWWREARFGMFIHWGVYSVPAGEWKAKPVWGGGEWIMNCGEIPVADYQQLPARFNPVKFDADAWVSLARAAGMKYIVITAKHHDGFAMFKSDASAFNIVDDTPFRRDPLAELAAACRKQGLKLGFYYSQAQDWNHPGGAAIRINQRHTDHWDPAQDGDMDKYLDTVAVPQVRELLTHYGEFPSVLWWDTPSDMTPERGSRLIALLKLKPGIIHNNRLGGGFRGDTETPEQSIPATGFPGRDWETCMTMNDTWGYKQNDQHWKPVAKLIRNLADIASKGGNYLLNVGPTSEGLIPGPSVERLQAVGEWMRVNGEAIYGTQAQPFKKLSWGRCTRKAEGSDTILYLHVFDWPADGKLLVPGLKNRVESARLLVDHHRLKHSADRDGVWLELPANAPDPVSSTIVLKIKGAPEVETPPLPADADGVFRLAAADADLQGGLQYEADRKKRCIGYWAKPEDTASWKIRVLRAGRYVVNAEIAAPAASRFTVVRGTQALRGAAPVTGDYGKFASSQLDGTLDLPAGDVTVVFRPVADGWQPVNLRSLELRPAK